MIRLREKNKKQFPKSIFELIDSENFRKRTPMYIREKSISKLMIFMSGYSFCEACNEIDSVDSKPPFWLFYHWICQYYNHNGSYYNWDGIILQNCDNDEEKALEVFFERFDEFKKNEPCKILKCKIDQKAIDFFYSHNSMIQPSELENYDRMGPSKEIYIIEYANTFGNTVHHRIEDQEICCDYHKTIEEAFQSVEREYGKLLVWEEMPNQDLLKNYDIINRRESNL